MTDVKTAVEQSTAGAIERTVPVEPTLKYTGSGTLENTTFPVQRSEPPSQLGEGMHRLRQGTVPAETLRIAALAALGGDGAPRAATAAHQALPHTPGPPAPAPLSELAPAPLSMYPINSCGSPRMRLALAQSGGRVDGGDPHGGAGTAHSGLHRSEHPRSSMHSQPRSPASPGGSPREAQLTPKRDPRISNSASPVGSRGGWRRRGPKAAEPLPLLAGGLEGDFAVDHASIRTTARLRDLYHTLLDFRWHRLLLLSFVCYFFLVGMFAFLFKIDCWGGYTDVDNSLHTETKCELYHLFYFSMHTISTTGYGISYPQGPFGQLLAGLEMWVGVTYACVASAFAYSKMSRPTRLREAVIFSRCCVVNDVAPTFRYQHRSLRPEQDPCNFTVERGEFRRGELSLQFRLGHTHRRQHISSQLRLYLYEEWDSPPNNAPPVDLLGASQSYADPLVPDAHSAHSGSPTPTEGESCDGWKNGAEKPRPKPVSASGLQPVQFSFEELEWYSTLQHGRLRGLGASQPLLCLPITVVHHIDDDSPLRGVSLPDMRARRMEIVAVYEAVDEGCSDSVQCRQSWRWDALLWGRQFSDMVFRDRATGRLVVDFQKLDETAPAGNHGASSPSTLPASRPRSPGGPRDSPTIPQAFTDGVPDLAVAQSDLTLQTRLSAPQRVSAFA